ncbi:hypothetical protein [Streptomyces adonidis]|uniref:hypothetical protein n=1 Tax=Streptomyces adonidis TaxID=3231367 RepID=UPI0034DB16C4
MSGIRRGQVVRVTGASRSPGHEYGLAPAAVGAQMAVIDEVKTTGGTADAGSGIVNKGART